MSFCIWLLAMTYEIKNKSPNPNFDAVFDIEPKEVLENPTAFTLVDVREDDEFIGELGHVESATLINLRLIPEKLLTIPAEKPVVFICRSGGRSSQACSYAHQHGLKNSYNMRGGMILWNQLQYPVLKTR